MGITQRRRTFGFKIEAVEGTPETIAAADIIHVENLKWNPTVETLKHETNVPSGSSVLPSAGRSMGALNYGVRMYGGNAAGTAPFWGKLLRSAGFSETIVASTSVTYQPISTALESATIKAFVDGLSFRMKGARSTFGIDFEAGQVPLFNFLSQGVWEPQVDAAAYQDEAALAGSALPSFQPKPFKAALFKIADTYKAIVNSFRLDMGLNLIMIPDGNVTAYKKTEIIWPRGDTGEFDVEAVTVATYDFWSDLANKTAFQVECFIGADDSGNGTGSATTMTDTSKNWPTNKWNGKSLRDSAGTVFSISSNTATALTLASGTPASGDYIIYDAGKLVRVTLPKCVADGINDNDFQGLYHYGVPFSFYQDTSSGDDEIVIQIT